MLDLNYLMKKNKYELIKELIDRGWTESQAFEIVNRRKNGKKKIL